MFTVRNVVTSPFLTGIAARGFSASRAASADLQFVKSEDHGDGIYCLKMNRKPVNSFNAQHMTELVTALGEIEEQQSARAIVVTSELPTVFSAGLDIKEMYQPEPKNLETFYTAFQNLWLRFYSSKLALVAAINGHALAGGCMLALTCDYRIMVDSKASIGLNETRLGVVAPLFMIESFVRTVGYSQAERLLQQGTTVAPKDALGIGLVDDVVPAAYVMPRALEQAMVWSRIDFAARAETKRLLRQEAIDKHMAVRQTEKDNFCSHVISTKVQMALGSYLDSLKKGTRK